MINDRKTRPIYLEKLLKVFILRSVLQCSIYITVNISSNGKNEKSLIQKGLIRGELSCFNFLKIHIHVCMNYIVVSTLGKTQVLYYQLTSQNNHLDDFFA